MTNIKSIDFSINSNYVQGDFERIADELLNHWVLVANDRKYRIAEIEFYWRGEGHDDTYVHGHYMQKTSGKWYFHGSGIDLTLGNEHYFGGILFRAIYCLDNSMSEKERYIYGPLKILTELFGQLGSAFDTSCTFGIEPDSEGLVKHEKVFKAPRVGLNPQKDKAMHDKPYRFLVMPRYEHKEKERIARSLNNPKEVEELLGYKLKGRNN